MNDQFLYKFAKPFGIFAAILTLTIVLMTNDSLKSAEWSTGLTAFGAILGLIGIWITLKIYQIGVDVSQNQEKILKDLSDISTEIKISVVQQLREQRFNEFRRNYSEARNSDNESSEAYWDFVWRFEFQNNLGLGLLNESGEHDGHVNVTVEASNIPALPSLGSIPTLPIYTVNIRQVQENDQLHTGTGYCTCINGKMYISNSANELYLQNPTKEFYISSLTGATAVRAGERPKRFSRLKDLETISNAQRELE